EVAPHLVLDRLDLVAAGPQVAEGPGTVRRHRCSLRGVGSIVWGPCPRYRTGRGLRKFARVGARGAGSPDGVMLGGRDGKSTRARRWPQPRSPSRFGPAGLTRPPSPRRS